MGYRPMLPITRADKEQVEKGDRVPWLDQLAVSLAKKELSQMEKQSLEIVSANSFLDQINGIFNRGKNEKPKPTTVAAAVEELKERIGLNKKALNLPEGFQKFSPSIQENVLTFLKNKIKTNHGQTNVPQLQSEVLSAFKNQNIGSIEVESKEFIDFLKELIKTEAANFPIQEQNHSDIGLGVGTKDSEDSNQANSDVFHGLTTNNGR